MKYACFNFEEKKKDRGGDYWKGVDFAEHIKLTDFQSTYIYILKKYPPPRSILEAGCGIGRWVIPLSQNQYTVTGIEIEGEAIEIMRNNFSSPNINLIVGDIFKMNLPDNSFDLVLSLGVLEHFEDGETQKDAILEHIRVMKDDGVFLITVPYLSLLRFIVHIPVLKIIAAISFILRKKTFFTRYRYSRKEFEEILVECGLNVIDTIYDDFFPPYNMGLTVGFPFYKLFLSKKGNFRLNKFGLIMEKIFRGYPRVSSGGIGYVCKKTTKKAIAK